MTWTWQIDGLGTTEQTLRVFDSDGVEQYSETRKGWSWSGDYPNVVQKTVVESDPTAGLIEDIERAQS